jgi:D-aminopeptidase
MVHAKSVVDRKGRLRLGLVDAANKLVQEQPDYTEMVERVLTQLGVVQ